MGTPLPEMGTDHSSIELDEASRKLVDSVRLGSLPGQINLVKEEPSQTDKDISQQPARKPSLLFRLPIINRLFRPRSAAVIGASLVPAALVVACTPASQPAEVRTAQGSETITSQPKIQVIHEASPDKSLETWKVIASNPPKQAEFDFVNNTRDGKKSSTVSFPTDKEAVSSDYRMVVTADSSQKAHLEYVTPDNASFLDISLNLDVPAKIDDKFTEQVFASSEDPDKITGITITNPATKEQVSFQRGADNDIFKGLLQALAVKKALAAEIPATPTATATPPPTETPAPPATATATATAVAKPEVKENAPCGILPDKYCSQAEFVVQKLPNGGTMKMIGFHLPAETPVFLPEDGQITKTKLVDHPFFKGYQATIFDPNNPKREYIISGDIIFDDMFSLNMKKGNRFGKMQNTNVDMIGYNLIIYVADIDANGNEVVNESVLREMFPAAFAKPAREVTFTGPMGGSAIHTTVYLGNSPTK